MVLDGLYMSLIGLAVVFMVLVFLLITINLLNYFDRKPSKKIIEEETTSTLNKSESNISNTLGINKFFVSEYQKASVHYPMKKISKIISLIKDTDLKSKGFNSSNSTNQRLLDQLIVEIIS